MTYELAKELKEAGFPQPNDSQERKYKFDLKGPIGETVYFPTLSELIEACPHTLNGRGVFMLCSSNAGELWIAEYISFYPPTIKVDDTYSGKGSTPEIAVGRLWLALQKP